MPAGAGSPARQARVRSESQAEVTAERGEAHPHSVSRTEFCYRDVNALGSIRQARVTGGTRECHERGEYSQRSGHLEGSEHPATWADFAQSGAAPPGRI